MTGVGSASITRAARGPRRGRRSRHGLWCGRARPAPSSRASGWRGGRRSSTSPPAPPTRPSSTSRWAARAPPRHALCPQVPLHGHDRPLLSPSSSVQDHSMSEYSDATHSGDSSVNDSGVVSRVSGGNLTPGAGGRPRPGLPLRPHHQQHGARGHHQWQQGQGEETEQDRYSLCGFYR